MSLLAHRSSRHAGRRSRLLATGTLLLLPFLLQGCASDDDTQTFAPLTYTYLSQIHLNVGRLNIVDNMPPGTTPGDISAKAPVTPQQALEEMARDRLIASGADGSATFTITRASILHEPGGTLQGDLDVRLDMLTPTGDRAGFTTAHVSRTLNPGDKDPESRSVLYDLVSQMMQDMNVELEFQIKKTLRDWLVTAAGQPLDNTIQARSLDTDPSASEGDMPTGTVTPAKAAASSAPDAIFPTGMGDDETPAAPTVHSPQPGVLTLPTTTGSTTSHTNGY